MIFLSGHWLWLLVPVAALAATYGFLQARRSSYVVRFTNVDLLATVAPRTPGWRRHVAAILFLGALASLVVALARPAREELVGIERATVVVAIDTSLSMQATDVAPSRFDAARAAARSFVDIVPEEVNIGLVSFAGTATIRVAPTTDRRAVERAIEDLALSESTAIGDAILASLAAVETVPASEDGEPVPAQVVLLSDGETTAGTPNEIAVAEAQDAGIPVSTIAFGTDEGEIELPEEPLPIPVPVSEGALEEIAETTGGSFYRALTGEELNDVYRDIGRSVGHEVQLREIGSAFIALALVLLGAAGASSLVWFSRLP